MSGKVDEDFWNTRSIPKFNFDDDVELFSESNSLTLDDDLSTSTVFSSTADDIDNPLPINALVSKSNLDMILKDVAMPVSVNTQSIQDAINRSILGLPCNFYCFRSLEDKTQLIDEALKTFDGNTILMVILFLSNTLRKNVFLRILSKRKVALRHYKNYLCQNNKLQELENLYMATGNSSYVIDMFYMSYKNMISKSNVLARLDKLLLEHSSHIQPDREKQIFQDHHRFLKWQTSNGISCESVSEALSIISKKNWEKEKEDTKLTEFRNNMKIGEFQYEWIQINTFATLQMWKKLSEYFIKPNWLTKKSTLRSVIDPELIVTTLYKQNAPKKVLEDFLSCIDDVEKSLVLAKKMQCHRFVIDQYLNQRDRCALISYKTEVPKQSEDYFYIENILRSSEKKWKN